MISTCLKFVILHVAIGAAAQIGGACNGAASGGADSNKCDSASASCRLKTNINIAGTDISNAICITTATKQATAITGVCGNDQLCDTNLECRLITNINLPGTIDSAKNVTTGVHAAVCITTLTPASNLAACGNDKLCDAHHDCRHLTNINAPATIATVSSATEDDKKAVCITTLTPAANLEACGNNKLCVVGNACRLKNNINLPQTSATAYDTNDEYKKAVCLNICPEWENAKPVNGRPGNCLRQVSGPCQPECKSGYTRSARDVTCDGSNWSAFTCTANQCAVTAVANTYNVTETSCAKGTACNLTCKANHHGLVLAICDLSKDAAAFRIIGGCAATPTPTPAPNGAAQLSSISAFLLAAVVMFA